MPETWQERKKDNMPKSKSKKLPSFKSLDKLIKFFDTHDVGEYWDQMPEVHFEVDLKKKRHLFSLDEELAGKISKIARSRRISSETLLNFWLREKILEQIQEMRNKITNSAERHKHL